MSERILAGSDVARIVGYHPNTISNWRRQGFPKHFPEPDFVTPGGRWFWRVETIEAYVTTPVARLAEIADEHPIDCPVCQELGDWSVTGDSIAWIEAHRGAGQFAGERCAP